MEQILTYNGYDMFEVVSALQKSIRRGKEEDAMFWGVELYISGFANYAWKRLQIIAMEDVGLANPFAALVVSNLKAIWVEMSAKEDKKNQERLPYTQAILYLTHCDKSRHTDWCQAYWFDEIIMNGQGKEIPDYALDIHTRRGKRMGKTIDNFFNEGSHLEKHVEISFESWYKERCKERWKSKEWCNACDIAKEALANRYSKSRKAKAPEPTPPPPTKEAEQGSLFASDYR